MLDDSRTFDKIHGLAGIPIGYTLAPRALADALRRQDLGEAESLGWMNIAVASAALGDRKHVQRVREAVAEERIKWNAVLENLHLRHTRSTANFIFFDSGHPQPEIASALHTRAVEIVRQFSPYANWARISIGLPVENETAQQQLRQVLRSSL